MIIGLVALHFPAMVPTTYNIYGAMFVPVPVPVPHYKRILRTLKLSTGHVTVRKS